MSLNVLKQNFGSPINENIEASNLQEKLRRLTEYAPIVLFMKGSSDFPKCGFSANTVQILNKLGRDFKTFDILQDVEVRQGLKEYSNWPTFPQLYIKGQLVGGNDIVTELYESGELQAMLKEA